MAFREQAAANRLADWSQIDVQLFNFHAAGASVKSAANRADGEEPVGQVTIVLRLAVSHGILESVVLLLCVASILILVQIVGDSIVGQCVPILNLRKSPGVIRCLHLQRTANAYICDCLILICYLTLGLRLIIVCICEFVFAMLFSCGGGCSLSFAC